MGSHYHLKQSEEKDSHDFTAASRQRQRRWTAQLQSLWTAANPKESEGIAGFHVFQFPQK